MGWRIRTDRELASDCGVLCAAKTTGAETEIITDFTVKKVVPGDYNNDFIKMPMAEFNEFMQGMMDAAYGMGLRPSRAQDERHQKAHLEDMRMIAFHKLGISK